MNPFGINIVGNKLLTEQYRFPRSKKRRIRKKWSKNPANRRPMAKGFYIDGTLYCHPEVMQQIADSTTPKPDTN